MHAVGGFYISFIIFVIAATGLVWSYRVVNNAIFYLFDGKPQQKHIMPESAAKKSTSYKIEDLLQQSNAILKNRWPVTISLSAKKNATITVTKTNDDASISNVVDFLYFDKANGQPIKKRLYKNETRGMKVRRMIKPIHTGEIFGWPTKIIALLCCIVSASLPVTGFIIWQNRKRKRKRK